jgi:tetratricopeptide (TPR) repeat protein
MLHDRYGLSVTTASNDARDAYVEGVDRILSANGGADESLERATAADPRFALAHSAYARWLQLAGRIPDARAAAARAAGLADKLSAREQQHVEIFSRIVNGRGQDALELTRRHIEEFPLDAFALSPSCGVFGLIGFSGRRDREIEQAELLEPLVEEYGDDWWFLTSYAFALVEIGQWERGRDLVERSLQAYPRNAHGAHVLSHALYESGEDDAGAGYLEKWLPEYAPEGQLHCHLWWHLGLFRLMLDDTSAMWTLYDRECATDVSQSPSINIASDGVSMLWRAELAGEPRSTERWEAIRQYIDGAFPEPMVFVDVHAALALAVVDDQAAFDQYIDCLDQMGRDARLPAGMVPTELGKAFGAFVRGDWPGVISMIEPIVDDVVRIGGSRAQRDLIINTLLAAYVKDGRVDSARAFLEARTDRRPTVCVAGL